MCRASRFSRTPLDELGHPGDGIIQLLPVLFGFQDAQDLPAVLRQVHGLAPELDHDPGTASYFLSRMTIEHGREPGMVPRASGSSSGCRTTPPTPLPTSTCRTTGRQNLTVGLAALGRVLKSARVPKLPCVRAAHERTAEAVRLDPTTAAGIDSPMGAAQALLAERAVADDDERSLLDLSQASSRIPPAPEVVERIIQVATAPDGAAYTPVPGLPPLRRAIADELSRDYARHRRAPDVVVTAGCNQAFSLAAAALAGPGDEIITAAALLLQPRHVAADARYPAGVPRARTPTSYPAPRTPSRSSPRAPGRSCWSRRATRAASRSRPRRSPPSPRSPRRHDIALILDETYRSFRDTRQPAHALFADPAWRSTLVSLHSYSKDLAIPGYRVGCVVAAPELNREVLKLMDCVAICAPRIGQEAALAGLTRAGTWRRARPPRSRSAGPGSARLWPAGPGGFEPVSLGGFFAWVRHPFTDRPTSDVVARPRPQARHPRHPGHGVPAGRPPNAAGQRRAGR